MAGKPKPLSRRRHAFPPISASISGQAMEWEPPAVATLRTAYNDDGLTRSDISLTPFIPAFLTIGLLTCPTSFFTTIPRSELTPLRGAIRHP